MGDDHSYCLVDGPWEADSAVAAEGFDCKGVEEMRSLALELLTQISQEDRIGFSQLTMRWWLLCVHWWPIRRSIHEHRGIVPLVRSLMHHHGCTSTRTRISARRL